MSYDNVKRILVIRPGAIGDLIHALPAIGAIRMRYPEAYIEVMGNPSTIGLVKGRYYANNISSFDRGDISCLFMKGLTHPQSVKDWFKSFDLIISYLRDHDQVFTENIREIGVRRVVNLDPLPIPDNQPNISCDYSPHSSQRLYSSPYKMTQTPKKTHIIDHLLKPAIAIGINKDEIEQTPRLYLCEDDKTFATKFFDNNIPQCKGGERLIAIHPGSGSKRKNWPIQKFIETARYLLCNPQVKLLIIYGPAEEEIGVDVMFNHALLSIQKIFENRINFARNIPLPHLAAILNRIDCFLGNDSGITHMAAAVGVPVVAIFGPTDPDVWAPRGEDVRIIRNECSCSPCGIIMKDCIAQHCLEGIEINEVINAVTGFITNNKKWR